MFVILGIIGAAGLFGVMVLLTLLVCSKKAAPDEALVVTRAASQRIVSFSSVLVLPALHEVSRVSLREHVLSFDRRGDEALRTRDDHAVELVASFRLRVSRNAEDVLRAAAAMGPAASDPAAVRERFAPALIQGLEAAARQLEADAIDRDRQALCDLVLETVGVDLDGFVLDDLSVTGVRITPGSPYRG